MNNVQTATLRPGLLVSLKTSIQGGIAYRTDTIEGDHVTDTGELRSTWQTEKIVTDAAEHEAATKARSAARAAVTRVCSNSAFGLLCPSANSDLLDAAVAEARAIADKFNQSAKWSRISVYAITGKIADDDAEAVRAINSEVSDLLAKMDMGLRRYDPKAIREAADAARQLGQMLTPTVAARVQVAIDAARGAARQIVKAGESAALTVNALALRKVAEARTAFLDLDAQGDIAAPVASGRAVDLAPAEPDEDSPAAPAPVQASRAAPAIDMPDDDAPAPIQAAAREPVALELF